MGWLFSQLRINIHNRISNWARKRSGQGKNSVRSRIVGLQVGNLLASLSTTGLMALGVIPMSLTALLILALILFVVGVIGKYIDSVEDDVERLLKYEEYIRNSASGDLPDTPRIDSVQQQSD